MKIHSVRNNKRPLASFMACRGQIAIRPERSERPASLGAGQYDRVIP